MKVLVTNPPWPGEGYGVRTDVRWPHMRKDKYLEYPLYLSYTVSVLDKAGFEVEFLDGVYEELSIPQFAETCAKYNPKLLVIECSTPSIDYDIETAKSIKERLPDTFVLLVGSHPTVFHRETLEKDLFIDGIARGEWDYTVRDVALALANGEDLENVEGISWRNAHKIFINENRPLIKNLDELPFPHREKVKIDHYKTAHYGDLRGTCVCTSRGCPHACTYCLWPNTLYGRRFRGRSPENVVDELEELTRDHGVEEVYFDDDTINFDMGRLIEICRLIRKRKVKFQWFCQARVDKVSEELLREMKAAGCYNIFFGVESGSPPILKRIKKGITLEQAERAFKLCRKLGIKTQAFFLLGIPGETVEDMKRSIEFAKKLKPSSAQFAIAIPHPGTELYRECTKMGWLKAEKWEDYAACNTIIETDEFSREDVEKARVYAYKHFYFDPRFILRSALRLKDPQDAKKVIKGAKSIVDRIVFYK